MRYFLKHVSNTVEFADGEVRTEVLPAPIPQQVHSNSRDAIEQARHLQRGGAAGRKVPFKGGDGRERTVTANFRIDGDDGVWSVTWTNGQSVVSEG